MGVTSGYQHFADLPQEIRDQILSEVGPNDPERWVHQTIPALGGRSFLETIDRPSGTAEIAIYLGRLREATLPGPHPRQLKVTASTARSFDCSANPSEWRLPWFPPRPGGLVIQRLSIVGSQLSISIAPRGLALLGLILLAFGIGAGQAQGPVVGVLVVAIPLSLVLFTTRVSPYDLQTAQVMLTRVSQFSTQADGFEITTEACGRTTVVWNIDVVEVTRVLRELGVPVSRDLSS